MFLRFLLKTNAIDENNQFTYILGRRLLKEGI